MSAPLLPLSMESEKIYDNCVSFLGRRQRHVDFKAALQMRFLPEGKESAGLAVLQASNHQFRLERVQEEGVQLLRLVFVTADFEIPSICQALSA